MKLEVGKVYTAHRKPVEPGDRVYHRMSTMLQQPDDYLHPIYKFFESEPFLVIDELHEFHDNESMKYRILVDGSIWFLIHCDEPGTSFKLLC